LINRGKVKRKMEEPEWKEEESCVYETEKNRGNDNLKNREGQTREGRGGGRMKKGFRSSTLWGKKCGGEGSLVERRVYYE